MARLYANNYTSTLSAAITNSATTLVVSNDSGLPSISGSDYYYLTLVSGGTVEIVKVTDDTSSPTLTVVRAQEGTSGVAWAAGSIISLRPTAESFSDGVFGGGSSTDNAIARWDGTDGTTLQDSSVLIDDSDNITGAASFQMNDSASLTLGTGSDATVQYDGTDLLINPRAVGSGDLELSAGDLRLNDSQNLVLGTGEDATIQYDGTDLKINPQAVGSGDVLITAGNLEINGSGAGVSFDSGSNVLDYYETGTFTPTFTCATPGDLSVSYSTQTGNYVRVGDLVYINLRMNFTPTFTTASGALRFAGLPFTIGGSDISIAPSVLSNEFTWPTSKTQIAVALQISTTYALLKGLGSAQNSVNLTMSEIVSGSSTGIGFSGTYII
jgi:hypothetical protein